MPFFAPLHLGLSPCLHTVSRCTLVSTLPVCWGDSYCSPACLSPPSRSGSLPTVPPPSMYSSVQLDELESSPGSSESSLFWTSLELLCTCLEVAAKEAFSSEHPLLGMDPCRPETAGPFPTPPSAPTSSQSPSPLWSFGK